MFYMYTLMDSYPLFWHTQKRVIGYEIVGEKARTHVMCTQHVIQRKAPANFREKNSDVRQQKHDEMPLYIAVGE